MVIGLKLKISITTELNGFSFKGGFTWVQGLLEAISFFIQALLWFQAIFLPPSYLLKTESLDARGAAANINKKKQGFLSEAKDLGKYQAEQNVIFMEAL